MDAPMATDQLLAFQRIVREGSFSRAAFALGIGQPAVSARIAALEQAVGGPLFTRGRRVALTPLGESFLPYVRRALDVLGEGLEVARQAQGGKRGRVTLGALGSLAGGLVGPALAQLLGDHPELECLVRAGDHERVLELLWDGMVELALVAWPCTEAFAAELEPLLVLHEPVPLVVSPMHPLARRRKLTRAELVREARPLYRLRWWRNHHPELVRMAEESGRSVDVPMEAARQLVVSGLGAGFFTRTYIADELARGQLVTLELRDFAPLRRDAALVRRGRAVPLSPAGVQLMAALRKQAQTLGLLARRSRV
jgi:LysR family transcriptional regulator, low CO2-responsive transcriptional regulator